MVQYRVVFASDAAEDEGLSSFGLNCFINISTGLRLTRNTQSTSQIMSHNNTAAQKVK